MKHNSDTSHEQSKQSHKMINNLMLWYAKHKRDLPWRHRKDAYAIWLSEIMLQQTTVATVIPYFNKFLEKYPTLESMALANLEDLLTDWAGLGYYNRIRNFHSTAKTILSDLNGQIPKTFDELLKLKGFGPYTAATVSSIAFNQPHACVDGNVMRVIARINNFSDNIKLPSSQKYFHKMANEWLDEKNPGDFNQAMMELGATICTPKSPKCLLCPVLEYCEAKKKGQQAFLPTKEKLSYIKTHWDCFIFTNTKKQILIRQRIGQSVMKDMWELPYQEAISQSENNPIIIIDDTFKSQGCVSHAIMNSRIKIKIWSKEDNKADKKIASSRWIDQKRLSSLPLTTVTKKSLKNI